MKSAPTITCVIVDDEFPAVKLLADYVQKTIGLELLLQTTSALEALSFLHEHEVDLVFVDVQMPELSGMELMNVIKNSATKVILTTAYTTYALDGYTHDIIDYLLKPITFERFLISVHKARKRVESEKSTRKGQLPIAQYIFVKTEYRVQKVLLSTVLYVEGLGDYIALHTTSGKILSLDRMKNMEELLPSGFLRIHKSYIINIDHIDFLEKGRIVINKEYLPVGESYKDKLRVSLGLQP